VLFDEAEAEPPDGAGLGFVLESYDQNDLPTAMGCTLTAFHRKGQGQELMRRVTQVHLAWKLCVSRDASLHWMAERKALGNDCR
jgi:hypothetical protein